MAQFLHQGPHVEAVLVGDDCERCALLVLRGGLGNGVVGHLALYAPPDNAGAVEMADDRGAVNAQLACECVDA